jgi:hypothetical protein
MGAQKPPASRSDDWGFVIDSIVADATDELDKLSAFPALRDTATLMSPLRGEKPALAGARV